MSFSPYSYATKARHGYDAPASGDFDTPSYLAGGPGVIGLDERDYGFLPALAAIPAWAWLTGAGTAAAGASYLYGKSEGATDAAAAAAAAQAAAAPPSGPAPYTVVPPSGYPQGYYPQGYGPPQQPTVPLTQQPWFWPVAIGGGAVVLYLLGRSFRR